MDNGWYSTKGVEGGFLAISEAAVVTVAYVVVVAAFVYKEIRLRQLQGLMRDAMAMVGGILLILGVSLAFSNYLIDAEVPARLFQLIQKTIGDKITFLILLNLFLLLLGACWISFPRWSSWCRSSCRLRSAMASILSTLGSFF